MAQWHMSMPFGTLGSNYSKGPKPANTNPVLRVESPAGEISQSRDLRKDHMSYGLNSLNGVI